MFVPPPQCDNPTMVDMMRVLISTHIRNHTARAYRHSYDTHLQHTQCPRRFVAVFGSFVVCIECFRVVHTCSPTHNRPCDDAKLSASGREIACPFTHRTWVPQDRYARPAIPDGTLVFCPWEQGGPAAFNKQIAGHVCGPNCSMLEEEADGALRCPLSGRAWVHTEKGRRLVEQAHPLHRFMVDTRQLALAERRTASGEPARGSAVPPEADRADAIPSTPPAGRFGHGPPERVRVHRAPTPLLM